MAVIIAGITPQIGPTDMPPLRKVKPSAIVETYHGGAYFSWDPEWFQVIPISWNLMPASDFNAFDAYYLNDQIITFDPGDGNYTFNCKMVDLTGAYNYARQRRKGVVMKLLILEAVARP